MHTIAIAGLGAIGYAVASGIDKGIAGIRLGAVSARNPEAARSRLESFVSPPRIVPLQRLHEQADIVLECGGAEVLCAVAAPALEAGKQLMVMSVGALLCRTQLQESAVRHRGRILIPSGAVGALDAVAAMAEGEIRSARLVTRKPPAALRGVPWLAAQGIDLASVREAVRVFSGPVGDAVRHFPDNLNVAAALALAGIGAQRTVVELWADPHARGNCHAIEVESDSGVMRFSIEGVACAGNPGTSSLAAQSALAMLRRIGLRQTG
jgi:aspartate dehydrogenase